MDKNNGFQIAMVTVCIASTIECVVSIKRYLNARKKRKMLEEKLALDKKFEDIKKEIEAEKEREENDPNSDLNRMRRLVKSAKRLTEESNPDD